ncbi:MAG: hypothetical protein DDT29_01177 [Dehalococcoidia bacterium]|nr:hypothetical protein [Bacillota bacterium]
MIRILKHNKTKLGIHHPLLAVDIENNPTTGEFICAGIFGDIRKQFSKKEGKKVKTIWTTQRLEEYFTDIIKFHNFLLSLDKNSCLLIFFNLSYDKVFLDGIIKEPELDKTGSIKQTVLTVGTRVILVTLKQGLKCMDLTNHVDGSLSDWIDYLKLTEKEGVYKVELTEYQERVTNDAKATYYLGTFLEDFYYKECGVPLCLTVGSNAMRLFTQKFFTDYWFRKDDFLSNYERNAYYGGRSELFQRGFYYTYSYDVNGMYLSIMKEELFPDVNYSRYINNGSLWQRYFNKYLGIYHCKVRAPDKLYLPVLPIRIDNKLKFPLGEFSGYWTSLELQEALKLGYQIIEVYDFVIYLKSKLYFKDYANFIWDKREEYQKEGNKGMDLMIKKLGNALYGKFAQRNGNNYFGRVKDYPLEIPEGVKLFEYNKELWVVITGKETPAKFEFPVLSVFISAYARLKLFKGMLANQESLIYSDTDSLKLTAPAKDIEIGNNLGQWSFQGEEYLTFYRPKFYGNKVKGVPKTATLVEETNEYKEFSFFKPLREREAIKRGLVPNQWREVTKVCSFLDDKRNWNGNQSSPLVIDENSLYQEFLEKEMKKHLFTDIDKRILKIPKKVIKNWEYELDAYVSELGFENAEELYNRYNYLKSLES